MPQRFLSYNGFALVIEVPLGITVIIAFSNFSVSFTSSLCVGSGLS